MFYNYNFKRGKFHWLQENMLIQKKIHHQYTQSISKIDSSDTNYIIAWYVSNVLCLWALIDNDLIIFVHSLFTFSSQSVNNSYIDKISYRSWRELHYKNALYLVWLSILRTLFLKSWLLKYTFSFNLSYNKNNRGSWGQNEMPSRVQGHGQDKYLRYFSNCGAQITPFYQFSAW